MVVLAFGFANFLLCLPLSRESKFEVYNHVKIAVSACPNSCLAKRFLEWTDLLVMLTVTALEQLKS